MSWLEIIFYAFAIVLMSPFVVASCLIGLTIALAFIALIGSLLIDLIRWVFSR